MLREGIYYLEAPSDGRAVFCMPWGAHTLVGTTETPFEGNPADVAPLAEEIAYLQEVHRRYFPEAAAARVTKSFAGLRVLPVGSGKLSRRSRETAIETDRPTRPRLLSIYGGKLTTYRATAARVLGRIGSSLAVRASVADTRQLRLGDDS